MKALSIIGIIVFVLEFLSIYGNDYNNMLGWIFIGSAFGVALAIVSLVRVNRQRKATLK